MEVDDIQLRPVKRRRYERVLSWLFILMVNNLFGVLLSFRLLLSLIVTLSFIYLLRLVGFPVCDICSVERRDSPPHHTHTYTLTSLKVDCGRKLFFFLFPFSYLFYLFILFFCASSL